MPIYKTTSTGYIYPCKTKGEITKANIKMFAENIRCFIYTLQTKYQKLKTKIYDRKIDFIINRKPKWWSFFIYLGQSIKYTVEEFIMDRKTGRDCVCDFTKLAEILAKKQNKSVCTNCEGYGIIDYEECNGSGLIDFLNAKDMV